MSFTEDQTTVNGSIMGMYIGATNLFPLNLLRKCVKTREGRRMLGSEVEQSSISGSIKFVSDRIGNTEWFIRPKAFK